MKLYAVSSCGEIRKIFCDQANAIAYLMTVYKKEYHAATPLQWLNDVFGATSRDLYMQVLETEETATLFTVKEFEALREILSTNYDLSIDGLTNKNYQRILDTLRFEEDEETCALRTLIMLWNKMREEDVKKNGE